MSTPVTGTSTAAPSGPAAATGFVMTARFTLALIAVQFGLAGLGAFQGLGRADAAHTWWAPHSMVGYVIGLLTLVLLAVAVVRKLGRTAVRWTAITAALAVIGQPLLAVLGEDASAWFGFLHALDGVVIAAVLGIVSARLARS